MSDGSDAIGRPDVTARFALVQAVVFLPLAAALLLLGFGIEGAAAAWALRAAADCGGKLLLAARFYPPAAAAARRLTAPLAGGGLGLALLLAVPDLPALLVAGALALGLFGLLVLRALEGEERGRMLGLLRHPGGLLRMGGGA